MPARVDLNCYAERKRLEYVLAMLSEKEGCALLKKLFEARGYHIEENVRFQERGVSFEADGWDEKARVGYEFMTLGERDHEDLQPDDLLALQTWTEEGKLSFLFIDETDVTDEDELTATAEAFLDAVKARASR